MAYRTRILAMLSIAFAGCSDDYTEQTTEKTKRLSDMDDDGMYMSDDCLRGEDEGCLILPGPTECTYLQVTTTTTVIIDAAGNVIREETIECVACLDADLNPISETCSGVTDPPIICEPVPYASDGGSAPSGGEGDAPVGTTYPYPSDCYWCHSEDGSISYYECIDPTIWCGSDYDCPSGTHCEYGTGGCEDPSVPCPATDAGGAPRIAVAGQCVPDAPVWCASDTDCPEGYYCEYYYPCDSMSGCAEDGGGSDGAPADALWAGGQCVPFYEPPPGCTSDADCGDGGTCVFYCDDFAGGCKGWCEYYPPPPPPCDCSVYLTVEECGTHDGCAWYETDVPCTPEGCGTSSGWCGPAYGGI
jgi:hypothetical protein